MYNFFFKRLIDLITAILALVILSPFLILAVIFLGLINRENPFFLQKRLGKNAVPFKIIKLRTMYTKIDNSGELLPDKERMIKGGKFFRRTSIDELPQIINVLKGEMSWVGPRPLLPESLKLLDHEFRQRLIVYPGITGWAQINGRNSISLKQRFKYDVWYVKNLSWKLDLKILFITLKKIYALAFTYEEEQVSTKQ